MTVEAPIQAAGRRATRFDKLRAKLALPPLDLVEACLDSPRRAFGRPLRRDALPEHTRYADTGCDVHPSCLTCPLVRCRYDEPGGARRIFSEERDRAIVRLQRERVPVNVIARRFGISRRTVFRVVARARDPSTLRQAQGAASALPLRC
jgi:hypothetical protein